MSASPDASRCRVEPHGDETLIYCIADLPYPTGPTILKAMRRAHYARLGDWPFQVAMRHTDDAASLILLARLARSEASETRLARLREHLSAQAAAILLA